MTVMNWTVPFGVGVLVFINLDKISLGKPSTNGKPGGEKLSTNTMVNIVDYFEEAEGDGLNIIWAHGVNSKEELYDALNDDTMMLEGDIVLEGMGTENETDTPVMAHPPLVYSDITLAEWLYGITETDKGMKLDFKDINAVDISMQMVRDMEARIHQPLWVNADIVEGPNSNKEPIPPVEFITSCNLGFPFTVMSLGWTTFFLPFLDDDMYTWTMIYDNLRYSYPLKNPVTFPVRALWVITSWPKFIWLLGLRERFSITVWHGTLDPVDVNGLVALRKHGDVKRIYYDLPDRIRNEFLDALEKYENVTVETEKLWEYHLWRGVTTGIRSDHVYISTEGAGLSGSHHCGFIESRREYIPDQASIEIKGRVQFAPKDVQITAGQGSGLEVYIRSRGVSNKNTVVGGVKLYIDRDGSVYLEPNTGNDDVSQTRQSGTVSSVDCYNFNIIDSGPSYGVKATITPVTCSDGFGGEQDDHDSLTLSLGSLTEEEKYYVVFTKTGKEMDVVLEDVHVLEEILDVSSAITSNISGLCYLICLVSIYFY
ncbi:menorin-like [Saccoglossus kowalevskii]|uniref:Uncharacterized protein LOC100369160 n=1 Tax=Saccoglossus kowalevskii TaxID=10224 RepID=A0ABM0GIB1_SACKO|nr:PREDICTED: uncharacterized protein LOC100369160 [Saccoglossus kowalevskii]